MVGEACLGRRQAGASCAQSGEKTLAGEGMTSPKAPKQNKPGVQCEAGTAESGTGSHRAM